MHPPAFAEVLPVDSRLDNSVSGFGTLRTAIKDACEFAGDDDITFNTWSNSFPDGGKHTIKLDGPLTIPSNCKGKVRIFGQLDAQEGVEVTLDASNVKDGECALIVEKDDTLIQKINIIKSKGKGICVTGNNVILSGVNLGYKVLAGSVAGNKIGVEISGNENLFYNGVVAGGSSHGIIITGDKNKVQSSFVGTTSGNEDGSPENTFSCGGDGIRVSGKENRIGGSPQFQNIVAHNGQSGIAVVTNGSYYNDLSYNIIYGNGDLGIDLKDDGVTENGACGDEGPNHCLWFPYELYSQKQGTGLYLVKGKAPAGSLILFYQTGPQDDDKNGEGAILLGTYNTGGNENSPDQIFAYQLSGQNLAEGDRISLMTCRKGGDARDCSEFSATIELHDDPSDDPDDPPPPLPSAGTSWWKSTQKIRN